MSKYEQKEKQKPKEELKISFWRDKEKKELDPMIFSERAEKLAKEISEEAGGNINKQSQLRKFYDEVQRIDMAVQQDNKKENWDNVYYPLLQLVVAKVAYAKGRKLVSDSFMNLIRSSINQVKSPEDLRVFAMFFEAFMGFYKLHGPKN